MTHIKAAIDELRAERDAAILGERTAAHQVAVLEERLAAALKRVQELEEALKPFAIGSSKNVFGWPMVQVGDYRRAAALLAANGWPASGEPKETR